MNGIATDKCRAKRSPPAKPIRSHRHMKNLDALRKEIMARYPKIRAYLAKH
jgi:hypothetical protein